MREPLSTPGPGRTAAGVRLLLLLLAFPPAFFAEKQIGESRLLAGAGYGVACLMVLAASLWRRESRIPFAFPGKDPDLPGRAWWFLPSSFLAALTFHAVRSPQVTDGVAMRLWLLSLAFLVLPFWVHRSTTQVETGGEKRSSGIKAPFRLLADACSGRPRSWKLEALAFLLLFSVAVAYRFPYLERYPIVIHNDSASCGLMARKVLEEWQAGSVQWFRLRAFYEYPTLGFIPHALFQVLFSPSLFTHRMVNVVGSLVALVCLYLLVRALLGPSAALLTLGLAAVGHFAVHWSRSGISCGQAAALMVFCPWLLWMALSTGRIRWFILLGVVLPMCSLTYQAALVIPPWIALVCGICWLASSRFRTRYTVPLLVTALSAAVFFAPMLAVYSKSPTSFASRRGSVIFSGLPLTQQHLEKAHGEHYVRNAFLDNLRGALLVFSKTDDRALQYGFQQGGVMDDVTAAAFVLGLAVSLSRLGNHAYWPLLLGLFLNWFLGGVLTVDAPRYHRISAMAFLMYVIPALYGREIVQTARETFGRRGTVSASIVVATGLVAAAFLNFRLYFIQHDHRPDLVREARRTCLAIESRDAGPDCITFVQAGPFLPTVKHQAQLLVAGDRRVEAFRDLSEVQIPSKGAYTRAMFLIGPEAKSIRTALQRRFPGGRLEQGILRFYRVEHLYDKYTVRLNQADTVPSSQ